MSKKQLQSEFLDRLEGQLEEQLNEVISVFQNLPTEVLLRRKDAQRWNIAECFSHLNSYADFYLPRVVRSLQKAAPASEEDAFQHSFLGRYFIRSMDAALSSKTYKAMKKHLPGPISDPHAVVALFLAHLEHLLMLVRKARYKTLQRNSVATSLAPLFRINVGDALAFLVVHIQRHLLQARQLLP